MSREDREIRRKMRIFEYAEETGNIRKTCRHFGIPRSLFYIWRGKYELEGEPGLGRERAATRRITMACVSTIRSPRLTVFVGRARSGARRNRRGA